MGAIKYSIVIIDDHPIIHDGLKTLLAGDADLEIVGSAASATAALKLLSKSTPDLAIIDLSLEDSDGTYLIQKIHNLHPKLKLLVYSMSDATLYAERVAEAGASGYVMKTSSPAVLKKAIRTILRDGLFFSPGIIKRIQILQNGRPCAPKSVFALLTNREMDVFRLVGQGLSSALIGQKLNISHNTVDTHRINIKNKLNLNSGKELERLAYKTNQQTGGIGK